MNKKLFYLFSFIYLLFIVNVNVSAKTIVKIIVPFEGIRLREEPTTASKILINSIPANTVYELESKELIEGPGCASKWYKVKYNDSYAYVCSGHVDILSEIEIDENAASDCRTDLYSRGFPESYLDGLCELQAIHPNWDFFPDFTGLDWSKSVLMQEYDRKALLQSVSSSTQGFLATDYLSYDYLTDTFIVKEGSNWYNASHEAIAYFLDPRNFFNEQEIFMFETLSFDESTQTVPIVQAILNGTDIREKSDVIYNAGKAYNINPIYLASRIKLETTGNYTNYSIMGVSYDVYAHIYNPYNIGANTGAADGIKWAAGSGSYNRPWTSLDTAINGGAQLISNSYISLGQNTTYFQKFNVSSYSSHAKYTNQYQTNVQGPAVESMSTYNGYRTSGVLDSGFHFIIPVYVNMPATASPFPASGNPNNHLKSITVGGKALNGFAHDTFNYNVYVAKGANSVNIGAEVINSKAKLSGVGTINLIEDETTVEINVVAENNSLQVYTLKVIRTDGIDMTVDDILSNMAAPISGELLIYGAGLSVNYYRELINKISATAVVEANMRNEVNFSTGDTINIINGGDSKSFIMVVKGDPSGDGNIDIQDLFKIQKYLLGYSDLEGSYQKAADTNQDGIVNVQDLLKIQKHILGYTTIS